MVSPSSSSTTMRVCASSSAAAAPRCRPRSITGTTWPRRFMMPSMAGAAWVPQRRRSQREVRSPARRFCGCGLLAGWCACACSSCQLLGRLAAGASTATRGGDTAAVRAAGAAAARGAAGGTGAASTAGAGVATSAPPAAG
ncbi:hypothetical protein G6F58_013003 [Rhizopus delemar]|nr:hypothetical protein G6F58_013003 [Rhizopus delemar]